MAAAHLTQLEREEIPPNSPTLRHETLQRLQSEKGTGVPLNTSWTFWVDKTIFGSSAAQYEANLRKLYTVTTVEEFWSVYNNIPEPSRVGTRYSYHLMRHDRKPIWEDPAHSHGGNWKLKVTKQNSNEAWRELLLAAIGEQFSECVDSCDEVGGVSICMRERDDVIQIWNTQSDLAAEAKVIEKVKILLPDVHFLAEFYKAFESHGAYEGKK